MSHFVVTKTDFHYNDEVYHTYDQAKGAGVPVKVFRSEKKAEEYVKTESLAQLRGQCLGYYGYGHGEISDSPDEFADFWKELTGRDAEDDCELLVPEDITDEKLEALYGLLSINFFNTVEVS